LEARELNPRSSIYDQRKIPLNLFTIGFQKPGICADSRNQESAQIPGFWKAQIPGFWNPMVKMCYGILLSSYRSETYCWTPKLNREDYGVDPVLSTLFFRQLRFEISRLRLRFLAG
jgi:hypothetical protein